MKMQIASALRSPDVRLLLDQRHVLGQFYPGFRNWLLSRVEPGLFFGTRRILHVTDGDRIAALAVLKNEISEKKICTFYVAPEYRRGGLGQYLLDVCRDELDEAHPSITVPEELYCQFLPLLLKNSFRVAIEARGLYRKNKSEFCFNADNWPPI